MFVPLTILTPVDDCEDVDWANMMQINLLPKTSKILSVFDDLLGLFFSDFVTFVYFG